VARNLLGLAASVKVVDLPDDYYKYDEARQRLLGRRHRKSFQLGDTVRVRVQQVDIKRRHVNLVLAEEGEIPAEPPTSAQNGRSSPRHQGKGRAVRASGQKSESA